MRENSGRCGHGDSSSALYRVGLIGCGRMGTHHARAYALNPKTQIVAAADSDPQNLKSFGRRLGVTATYLSYEEMLDREQLDIVAPVLPVSINPEVVIACARAGVRAIFCEKPIAASLDEADRMVAECRDRGVAFAAGDAFRNYPQLWKARAMVESGELGQVRIINVYDASSEISGGGCQSLCVARMFAQDAPVAWAVGWVVNDPTSNKDQGMGGYFRFTNDIDCFLHQHLVAKTGIEVICERGVFLYSGMSHFHLWKLGDSSEPPYSWANVRETAEVFPPVDLAIERDRCRDKQGVPHPGFRTTNSVQAIVDCLDKGAEPRCSGDDMRQALEMAIALRESHRRGHAQVLLPLADRGLKIIPKPSRWLNKKKVVGNARYAQMLAKE